jgi:hypothetical protein
MARRDTVELALKDIQRLLDGLDRRSEKMETILMVREPGSTAAADAYEGLRKQIIGTVSERLTHLTQLVQFDAAIRNGADRGVLAKMVQGWFESSGLQTVQDPDHPHADLLYEIIEDRGGPLEIVDPAYCDGLTGRVIRPGRARRLDAAPARAPSPPRPRSEQSRTADPGTTSPPDPETGGSRAATGAQE